MEEEKNTTLTQNCANEETPSQKTQNFLLELDEDGNVPNIQADELLKIPLNSNLKVKFYNGSKISKNAKMVTNAYDRKMTLDMVNKEYIEKIETFSPIEVNDNLSFMLKMANSGSVFFLFVYSDASTGETKFTKEVFVIVEPTIRIGTMEVNFDSIQAQTILSKALGKLEDWDHYFKEASLLNYNFVHFTPIQKLGRSESLYCIADNNDINNVFFESKTLESEEKLQLVYNKVNELREKYQIGFLVDIVLNHTASNSEWLFKHPQSGFNLENCPHLTCSYELDKMFLDYSDKYSNRKVSCNAAPYINNENDLNELMTELKRNVFKSNFEEFFLIPIDKCIDEFKDFFTSHKKDFKDYLTKKNFLLSQLKEKGGVTLDLSSNSSIIDNQIYQLIFDSCTSYGYGRYGVELNVEFISILVMHVLKDNTNESEFIKEIKRHLNKVNDHWYKKGKEFLEKAMENVRSYIKYEFLDLKRFKVTPQKRIVENYFAVFNEKSKKAIFACNGWLFGVSDPTINFAKYGNWHYFTRSIVIWGDCPKLNYGDKPEDSPYLWHHMTKYVQDMARIFNGFRLDNAHSTPIYVAEYLLRKAREVNPDLVVFAELFAGTKEREISFVNRIGINLLIREAIYCNEPAGLSEKLHKFGGGFDYILGKLDNTIKEYKPNDGRVQSLDYKYLTPSHPASIIYDLTHDNPTYYEKYNHLGLNLTFLATVGMVQASIGTTRGFDQLFPYQPSVVKENRLYQYDDNFYTLLEKEIKEVGKIHDHDHNVEYTFELNMNNFPQLKTHNVRLALSSNNWNPEIVLSRVTDKVFSVKLGLKKGIYYFKYVLDNNVWIYDHTAESVKDSKGNLNNFLDLREDVKYTLSDLKMVRRDINRVREDLSTKCNNQFFLHRDRDLICIFRMFSEPEVNEMSNYDGYAMICRCGYELDRSSVLKTRVELPGEIAEVICTATIHIPRFDLNIIRSDLHLIGVNSNLQYSRDIKMLNLIANITNVDGKDVIDFHSLLPNTVILLKIRNSSKVKASIQGLKKSLSFLDTKGEELIKKFDLCDINQALYKCEKEELDNTSKKRGNYNIKEYGPFVYAGITHIHQLVQKLKKTQALDHPMFANVREGDWLMEYTINRLSDSKSLVELFGYLNENVVKNYKSISTYLKPHYFCLIFDELYNLFSKRIFNEMLQTSPFLQDNNSLLNGGFEQNLFLAVLQFTGYVQSSSFISGDRLSIAAGLPHFATEYMRCWGRDTFIAFKGLLLIPGFFKEAKQVIKNFASTLRHGLIPNLLDGGNKPRYNARDATWFFLLAVKDYILFTGEISFLNEQVEMLFLDDDMNTHNSKKIKGEKKVMKISEIMFNILESHARGIEFKEWRAGKDIDEHMKDEGFNIKIYLETSTGFIYGGNTSNCGTWMDKMGSSEKARNKGVPSTPRDGADVEIIGILYSILIFVVELNTSNSEIFPFKNVKLKDNTVFSFYEWSLNIKDNFEKYFFVTNSNNEFVNFNNKKCIYKDFISHSNSKNKFPNFLLRPNFLIAMAVSPTLFNRDNALKSLAQVEKYLLVPNGMGIRTLEPEDKLYNGNYENSDDSNNYNTAHGFNYHNGPEWVWLMGFYLMSKINFNSYENLGDLRTYIYSILTPHAKFIKADDWKGLPELMNRNNSICKGSCNTQAWSIATILEGLFELNENWKNHKN